MSVLKFIGMYSIPLPQGGGGGGSSSAIVSYLYPFASTDSVDGAVTFKTVLDGMDSPSDTQDVSISNLLIEIKSVVFNYSNPLETMDTKLSALSGTAAIRTITDVVYNNPLETMDTKLSALSGTTAIRVITNVQYNNPLETMNTKLSGLSGTVTVN